MCKFKASKFIAMHNFYNIENMNLKRSAVLKSYMLNCLNNFRILPVDEHKRQNLKASKCHPSGPFEPYVKFERIAVLGMLKRQTFGHLGC